MIKLHKYLQKKEKLFIIFTILLIVLQVWLDLRVPDYMSEITKYIQTESSDINQILKYGGMMLLCSFGGLVCAVGVGYFAAYVGTNFEKNLRKKVFNKVEEFSMEEIKKFKTSSLITRNTNDVTQVKMFIIMGMQMLAKAPIMATMAIIKIVGKNWSFTLITMVGVFIILLLSFTIILFAIPRFKTIQKLTDNLNAITRENLTGIRVVRAYNAEKYQMNKFAKANNELTNTHMFIQKIMALMSPTMSTTMSGLTLAIYWVGASLINNANGLLKLNIFSDMVVFSSYSVQVIISFTMLIALFIIYPRASVSLSRINEVLNTETKIKYGKINKDKTALRGVVEFKNVCFKYPDALEYVLKDINFKAETGETIAIIGSTGSGKSTLVNLIPRFYDATSGEIFIDGINIKDMSASFLNDKLGYVSQKAILFKGTIDENIRFGELHNKRINKDSIDEALNIAEALEFVDSMPEGINSKIAQRGNNISGGQKQRLSIARAVARKPEIYIFDDSFSALDYKTDYKLRTNLNKKVKNATKFIVAQRIGTIKDADKIIVLDEGKIVGIGKHEELLKTCKVYLEIAESQLSKEEITNAWS